MEVREVRSGDDTEIEAVVRAALADHDDLDESAIAEYVEAAYGSGDQAAGGDPTEVVLVAEGDDGLSGVVRARLVEGDPVTGTVQALHVRPDEAGGTAAVRLLGEAVDRLADDGATVVRARVVASSDATDALAEGDLEQVGTTELDVAGATVEAGVYERRLDDDGTLLEPVEGPEGELFADFGAGETGTEAPLYPVYEDRPRETHYGWLCGNCDSLATSMDAAGRIVCETCDNRRTATEWDGSYL